MNKSQEFDSFYEYKEYYLLKDNNIYKIETYINNNKIIVSTNNYIATLNIERIKIIFGEEFDDILKAFEFLINRFDDNDIFIYEIIKKENLKLLILKDNKDKIKLVLNYNKQNIDYALNKINKLQNEINELKKQINTLYIENKNLKKEIESLKTSKKKDIKSINYLSNITNDSYADFDLDKTFIVFKSIDDILYLIYSSGKGLIISYNLINDEKICSIKTNNNEYITNFRHYLDKIKKRDLIISIISSKNSIRLWDIKSWNCILNINNINKVGYLDSACFLCDRNNNYIVTSNSNKNGSSEKIKIYDFKGQLFQTMNKSDEQTYFIDVYYDDENNNIYIITGSHNCLRTFDYKKNKLYQKYYENNNGAHICIAILKKNKQLKLIESCDDGNIRIWDFHSANLLKKIKVNDKFLFGICLWDNNYIFVGCEDSTIKLIEINKGLIVKTLSGYNDDDVLTLDKVNLPKYGECLISQGRKNDQIKIWC